METKTYYLSEKGKLKLDRLLYRIDENEIGTFVSLENNYLGKVDAVMIISSEFGETKRGWTFYTYAISRKRIKVFLAREDFDVLQTIQ